MGCDYYISKFLKIKFVNSTFELMITLERDTGYYSFSMDEDDPDYDEKYEEYIKETLQPGMKPIVIYEYDIFTSKKLEDKYKPLIDAELERYNNSCGMIHRKEWKDIREISKRERRYERD
jgi:hypothetical protein